MEDDGIGSAAWWISSVVVALTVNLASSYLKPRLDTALLRTSAWWRAQSEARIEAHRRLVRAVADELNLAYLRLIAERARAIEWFVMALLGLGLANIGSTVMSAPGRVPFLYLTLGFMLLCMIAAFRASNTAIDLYRLIREAETLKARDAESSSSSPPISTHSTS